MRLLIAVIACFSVLYSPSLSQAQGADSQRHSCEDCCCCDCLLCRDALTGDWLGHRDSLARHGIVVQSSLTQFYQNVASGGVEQTARYGSKFDLFVLADTSKMGL